MKKNLTELIDKNIFFLVVLGFVFVLPLSSALVSVFAGLLLVTALIEDSWGNKIQRLKQRKILLSIAAIFLIYIVATLLRFNDHSSFYDVRKTMFFFGLPVAFALGKDFNSQQKRYVFYTFGFAVFISTVIALCNWKLSVELNNFSVHEVSLISHIRFSFQLILSSWFFIYLVYYNRNRLSVGTSLMLLVFSLYFILFLLFQQSLTGILALGTSFIFFLVFLIGHVKILSRKVLLIIVMILGLIIPAGYIGYVVNRFYDIEEINKEDLPEKTELGNLYSHDLNNKLVENGHYVYLFVNDDEMREAWNKISEYKFDEPGQNGYPISATLKRYLTSKGFYKDDSGVKQLTAQDVINVEKGMANVIFENHYSLYPRIYQTVWEYYVYTTTGNPNNQSFSQRIEFVKAAITIIKDNFLFGVGPGNWREEFSLAYKNNNSQLAPQLQGSSHNQYLNYMVKFGMVGFVLIMFLLIWPIVHFKRYSDVLFITFLVFMFFANFADSNLESHMGSSFFVFFYCIFITGEKNYLKLGYAKNSPDNHHI